MRNLRLTRLISSVLVVTAATLADCATMNAQQTSDAALDDSLVSLERQSWVAWKGHDGSFYQRVLADDHVEVGARGVSNKASVVKGVSDGGCRVESDSLTNFRVTRVAENTAILTYPADQKTLCGSTPLASPTWVTSAYVKRCRQWLNVLFQKTTAAKS